MGIHPFERLPSVMKAYSKALVKTMEEATIEVARAGTDRIIDGTPVDTTRAVSNWKLTHGAPHGGYLGARVPGSVKGSGAGAAKSIMKGEAHSRAKAFKNGIPMYFSNMAPYIWILEYGDSKHRPAGMVAKGIQAMAARARTIKLKVRPNTK